MRKSKKSEYKNRNVNNSLRKEKLKESKKEGFQINSNPHMKIKTVKTSISRKTNKKMISNTQRPKKMMVLFKT